MGKIIKENEKKSKKQPKLKTIQRNVRDREKKKKDVHTFFAQMKFQIRPYQPS